VSGTWQAGRATSMLSLVQFSTVPFVVFLSADDLDNQDRAVGVFLDWSIGVDEWLAFLNAIEDRQETHPGTPLQFAAGRGARRADRAKTVHQRAVPRTGRGQWD
jgi:hypothetical protein